MTSTPVLVIGATSAIARAVAEEFASRGQNLYLAGRDLPELWRLASDFEIRHGVSVQVGVVDAEDFTAHGEFVKHVVKRAGGLAGVVVALGYLGDQSAVEQNPRDCVDVVTRNYSGAMSLLLHLANHFEETRTGFVIGISSIAGDRGRVKNYVYGSAKAGMSAFLQGLRARLHKVGVHVMTVKPGFVDTSMTYGMDGLMMLATPEDVGKQIVRALERRKDIAYVPGIWKWVMLAVRTIPERIFKKMKF